VTNDRAFVERVVALLRGRGLDVTVTGGWATELAGAEPTRPHSDIDLLYARPPRK
jgi:hypothetical protein